MRRRLTDKVIAILGVTALIMAIVFTLGVLIAITGGI